MVPWSPLVPGPLLGLLSINNVLSIHLVAYICEPKTAGFAAFCAFFLAWLFFPAVSHSFLAFLLVFLCFLDKRPKC